MAATVFYPEPHPTETFKLQNLRETSLPLAVLPGDFSQLETA